MATTFTTREFRTSHFAEPSNTATGSWIFEAMRVNSGPVVADRNGPLDLRDPNRRFFEATGMTLAQAKAAARKAHPDVRVWSILP